MQAGGAAGKLGNEYESLWTIRQLFDVLDGTATELEVEPLDDGVGIEFRKRLASGEVEHHSVKIQTPNSAWTVYELARDRKKPTPSTPDGVGTGKGAGSVAPPRSFLGDLLHKTNKHAQAIGVFVSEISATTLKILCEDAQKSTDVKSFQSRVGASAERLDDLKKYILPKCGNDWTRARNELRRIRVETVTREHLLKEVERDIARSFYTLDGRQLDLAAVRRSLAEFITESLGNKIDRNAILGRIAKEGLGEADWATDPSIRKLVGDRNATYRKFVTQQLINGKQIPRRESGEAFDFLVSSKERKFGGFIGVAGLGKSCTTAELLERLDAAGIPYIVIRLDVQTEAMTARVFGQLMSLPTSPVDVIAGIASGGPCVLVVDQLDALSVASGRNPNLWLVFDDLLREAQKYPNLCVWFACREFDLETDPRLRELVKREKANCIRLALLDVETVKSQIREAGVDPAILSSAQVELLRTPMHLSLYIEADPAGKPMFNTVQDLYQRYWEHKQNVIKERIGRPVQWTPVIDLLCDELSRRQALSAPASLIDDVFRDDALAMTSAHVLVKENDTYRFFHEGFFDYAFARRFVVKGGKLLDLLLREGEQHLFRRAQVRQVLAFLRGYDRVRYFDELRDVLNAREVRPHIKKLIFDWLRSLPDPTQTEAEILKLNE